ncbi:hypothetical protein [Streptomyces sp. ML-6]|uniref:hypothetical protein n=1 Tax=Streptomyces sp. ML-6 TaxID=2982693 RepID=UPI0024BF2E8B|nr:hypothetical protein [Streptomyces sp. ML-6]MDK0524842.1 hypothetical protein [Streptomyces sp. ML-6]
MNVPVGELLAGLAVPYLTSVVRTLTRRGLTDRAERLRRPAPGLGLLAVAAAVRWPYLAHTVPVPVELAVAAAFYLLILSVSCWLLPPEPGPDCRAAYDRLATPWAVTVLGTFLIAVSGPVLTWLTWGVLP